MIKRILSFISVASLMFFVFALPEPANAANLSCSPQSVTVAIGQPVTFTASGGTGSYVWVAPDMSSQTGSQLTVYYPYAGTSSVTVTSGTETATCSVNIYGTVAGDATTLSCVPSQASVDIGEVITFSAVGGDGNYVWAAPDTAPRSGSTFTAYYQAAGTSSVTVTSAGQTAICNVAIGSVLGDQTPGLPNTGLGGGSNLLLNLGMVLALSGITTTIARKKMIS